MLGCEHTPKSHPVSLTYITAFENVGDGVGTMEADGASDGAKDGAFVGVV